VAPEPTRSLDAPLLNPVQTQRFLQRARSLKPLQLQQIQTDYDSPTFGRKNIELRIGHADYEALGSELDIAYVKHDLLSQGSNSPSYGPGLQPLAEAVSLIAYWRPGKDLKDFITVYAPLLKYIPLAELGLSDDWMVLEDPARHRPIVAEYERVLEANRGAVACKESLLPAPRQHVIAAICFQAALDEACRDRLADELVEVAAFVPDADASLVASNPETAFSDATATILGGIRNRELELMTWLGTIDAAQLDDARRNIASSAIPVGSEMTVRLITKSKFLLSAYVIGAVTGLLAGVAALIYVPRFQSPPAWIACLIWSWVGGLIGAALVSNGLIKAMPALLGASRWQALGRIALLLASAMIAGLLAAGPWLLLARLV
jgi:hypothetical protein